MAECPLNRSKPVLLRVVWCPPRQQMQTVKSDKQLQSKQNKFDPNNLQFAPPHKTTNQTTTAAVGHPIRGHGYAIETSLGQKNISNVPSMGTSRGWFGVAPSSNLRPSHILPILSKAEPAGRLWYGGHGRRSWLLWTNLLLLLS